MGMVAIGIGAWQLEGHLAIVLSVLAVLALVAALRSEGKGDGPPSVGDVQGEGPPPRAPSPRPAPATKEKVKKPLPPPPTLRRNSKRRNSSVTFSDNDEVLTQLARLAEEGAKAKKEQTSDSEEEPKAEAEEIGQDPKAEAEEVGKEPLAEAEEIGQEQKIPTPLASLSEVSTHDEGG